MLCNYGCGNEAMFTFKNGKHCCSKNIRSCTEFKIQKGNRRKKRFDKIREEKRKELESKIGEILCEYGCGNKSLYLLKNNKYCCSDSNNKCINMRKINSNLNSGINHHMYGKNHSEKTIELMKNIKKYSSKDLEKYHKVFYKIEEPIDDEKGNILVKCKYCGKRFVPTFNQLWERVRQLETKTGNGKCFFYCSKEHKNLCPFFRYHTHPDERSKYYLYQKIVLRNTYKTVVKFYDKIENYNLRSDEYHLDHKYSIYEGYKNNVDPIIISHWKNLEIIKNKENCSKKEKCSITLENLIEEIKSIE